MKVKQVVASALVSGLVLVCSSPVPAQTSPSVPIGTGHTLDKPQSKLWYTVDPDPAGVTWWAILSDGVDLYFHKLVGGVLQRQTFQDAMVDADNTARADVVWNGTHLFVLLCKGTSPGGSETCNSPLSLSTYSYDPISQIYTREAGFPVSIPISSGSESATLAQDSTGRLWIAYDPGTSIRVLWSDPPHTAWSTMTLNTDPVDSDDLAAIVAFTNCVAQVCDNAIGVMWSNQDTQSIRFRFRRDGDAATTWQAEEVVATGGAIADDHINLAVTDAGDIVAATKSSSSNPDNTTNVFVRRQPSNPADPWEGPYFVTGDSSRSNVVFDRTNRDVYVFYTGSFDSGPRTISYKVANLSQLSDLTTGPEIDLISASGQDINNVTSTKQAVDATTGLLVVAKDQLTTSASRAYYEFLTISAGSGNSPPVANSQSVSTPRDTPVAISFQASDPDGDALSFEVVTGPANGSLAPIPPSGTPPNVTYTPNPAFVGPDAFTFRAYDGQAWSAPATVSLAVTAPIADTGLLSPTANAAVTSSAGDNNGFQGSPGNAHANDGLFAVDTNSGNSSSTSCTSSGKDKHRFYNYGVAIPGSAAIKGIEVRLDAKVDATSGSPKLCVQLSWNGGATWTTAKSTPTLTTSEATYVLGSAADLWGRTWAVGDFSNTNLRVRVISVASSTSRDFSLDWVAVRVTYQP